MLSLLFAHRLPFNNKFAALNNNPFYFQIHSFCKLLITSSSWSNLENEQMHSQLEVDLGAHREVPALIQIIRLFIAVI